MANNKTFHVIRCSKVYQETMLDVSNAVDAVYNTKTIQNEHEALKKLSFAAFKAMKYLERRISLIAAATAAETSSDKDLERKL